MDKKNGRCVTLYFLSALGFSLIYWWFEFRYLDTLPLDPMPNLPNYLLALPLPLVIENLLRNIYEFSHIPVMFQELATKMVSSFFLRVGLLIPAGVFWGVAISELISYGPLVKIDHRLKKVNEKKLLLILFFATLVLTNCISYFLYRHEVHIADSNAYLFQAKIFASGQLYVKAPPVKEFFDYGYIEIMNDGEKWYSTKFFGHSFMLLWGVLFGIPWAVGPLLTSLSVVLIYLIGKEMYGIKTGFYAALFGILSPFLLFISTTYMSHSSSLFFICLSLFFFVRTIKYGKWFDPLLTGIFLGMELNTRPLISLTLGFPIFFFFLYFAFKAKAIQFKTIIIFATPCIIFSAVFLFYNYLLTGDPFLSPYENYRPAARFGFGEDLPEGGYNPIKGLFYNLANMYNLNDVLFGWPGLSLLFLLVFLLSSKNKWDYLLLSFFALTIIAHYFHFGKDTRIWFGTMPALLFLTLKGIKETPLLLGKIPFLNRLTKERLRFITAIFVCFLFLQSFFLFLPKIIKQYRNDFWDAEEVLFSPLKEQDIQNAVIFMDVSNTNYDIGFSRMSPDLKDDVIFARDLGGKNTLLMKQFLSKNYYRLSFNEITRKARLTPIFNNQ